MKANLIKHLEGWQGDARLYQLDTPIEFDSETSRAKTTRYVVVSAVFAMFTGPETYIFPADHEGNALDWGELKGSLKGEINHERALRNAGYEVEDENYV